MVERWPRFVFIFGKLPQHLSDKEVNRYLASVARQSKTPSLSDFKFYVHGLRYCYRLLGMNEKALQLPKIREPHKLPVVLNRQECIAIFKAPELLKHRVLLSLIYSAGLRAGEASRLKIADIDSGRMMIHIRQSKFNKDRYVPLSPLILQGLRKYYYACQPVEYLFNGNSAGSPLSIRGMQWALREAVKKCKLQRILRAVQHCRTSELGWHNDRCDACGHIRISYNSCRNRHCPKCQNTQREAWIENRKRDLLPVPYFHVVFTVPDKLNSLFISLSFTTKGVYSQ